MKARLYLLLGTMALGQQLWSQTCCSGGVPLSNNLGMSNEGKGSLQIGLNYDYNNLSTLNAGTERLDDDSRERVTNSVLLGLGYAFTDRLSLETLFTWVNQTRTISQFGNTDFTETTGLGDAVVLGKYAIPNILGLGSLLHLGLGTKAPLGRADLATAQGIQLTADLQPGSGAWDGLGWLSFSKNPGFRPSASISASTTYRLTGKNRDYLGDATYEFGDEVQLNLGYTDQLLLWNMLVSPGLVLKYRHAAADAIDAREVPNTGGEWVFLRPELKLQLTPAFSLASRLELPLYSKVEGTQLTPTVRVSAGMFITVNTKSTNPINL